MIFLWADMGVQILVIGRPTSHVRVYSALQFAEAHTPSRHLIAAQLGDNQTPLFSKCVNSVLQSEP